LSKHVYRYKVRGIKVVVTFETVRHCCSQSIDVKPTICIGTVGDNLPLKKLIIQLYKDARRQLCRDTDGLLQPKVVAPLYMLRPSLDKAYE
jgi:hypothetical protein